MCQLINLDQERTKRGKSRLLTPAERAMYAHNGTLAFGRAMRLDALADRGARMLHDCGNISGMPEWRE